MKTKNILILSLFALLVFTACKKDEQPVDAAPAVEAAQEAAPAVEAVPADAAPVVEAVPADATPAAEGETGAP